MEAFCCERFDGHRRSFPENSPEEKLFFVDFLPQWNTIVACQRLKHDMESAGRESKKTWIREESTQRKAAIDPRRGEEESDEFNVDVITLFA